MPDGLIEVQLSALEREPEHLSVTEVTIPGADGVFSVLPMHTPMLTTLVPGVVVAYEASGHERYFAISGGFAEVKDDRVTILAGAFEPGEEIDLERARAAHERAEARLAKPGEDVDIVRAELACSRALARIGAHNREPYSGGPR